MKKNLISIIVIFFFSNVNIHANPFAWNFERHYKDKLLYIHSLLNYELNPLWHFNWEENLIRKSGIIVSFGSVEIDDLLCNTQVVINQNLGSGWWFRAKSNWYASQHKNTEEKSNFLGFEKNVFKNYSLFFLLAPAFNKEEFDIKMGISITNSNLKKYFRVALCLDDFVYDQKNDKGGKTSREPVGIEWLLRYGKNKLWFFSEGKYSKGFKRNYRDIKRSPEVNFHQQQINNLNMKLHYHVPQKMLLQFSFSHYHFSETKKFYDSALDYSYLNEINDCAFKSIFRITNKNRIRLESHYIIQNSNCCGFKNFKYKRRELLPAFFYEYILKKNTWEVGLMGAMYNWDYDAKNSLENYDQNDFVDKVKLGWTYNFNQKANLQISISHVISINGFGGGNVQYLMFF